MRLSSMTRALLLGAFSASSLIIPTTATAQSKTAGKPAVAQATDPEFAKLQKEWTTKPEFSSPLVDFLPLKKGIPTTKEILGRYVGQPNRLTTTTEAYKYYRALEKASPRVKIVMMGKTDEGRDQFIVNIANEQTIKDLEIYRGYLGQIADPRKYTPEQMKAVIEKAKPIYYVSGGQHSPETGPSEMLMELAYRLVADDSPMYQAIRDNIIVSINPVVEPDGRDRVVDWYHRHKVDETDERTASPGPPYWGKYVFHDNNRDINYSQVTMKNVLDWYLKWHPPIMHDLHESVPFMYTFSGQAPQNPTLDPILYSELPWFSNYEKSQMAKFGMPGVWDFGFVDMWSPGYLAFMSSNHNGIIRMYETFGNGGATTMKRKVAPEGGGPSQTTREWYRPWPPYKEVVWSMRNNTNYMETGVLSALELTSKFPKVILENFYKKTTNSIESGKKDAPYGYVIPGGQKDQTRVAMLINLLRIQGVEVGKATSEITVKEGKYPAGSYIIKRDQPYGRLAKILLEKQNFPDANLRTYDDTGWTMGLMEATDVKEIADLAILQAAVEPVDMIKLQGSQTGAGRYIAVANFGANNMATLRFKFPKVKTLANEKATTIGGTAIPAGSLWFDTQGNDGAAIKAGVESLGLTAVATDALPSVATHEVDLPRLAVFSTWGNTQEVGWVRHALDYYGIPFTLIYKEQVKAGNLAKDYDVLLIPNQGRSAKGLVFDIPSRGKPLPYKKDPKYATLGGYGESDDITGGMGLEGASEINKFVNGGGSLVTLAAASYFPPEFGIAEQIDARTPSSALYAPGPIIETEVQAPDSPIFYGYDKKTIPVRYGNGPLLNVPELLKDRVLLKYVGGEKSVLSGLFKSPNEIKDRPAIVDLPQGKGQIVLFAGNPCYRWQNHGEFGMLFNTILHWNDLLSVKAPMPVEKAATEQ
ncbi:MAG: M14 family zinc carboxypeptidase [Vicinamibacteria bacterium]